MKLIEGSREYSEAEWRQARVGPVIGGSDVAAMLGMNPWKSPFALWAEKTGRVPLSPISSFAARIGKTLEDEIARATAAKIGADRVRRINGIWRHDEHAFAVANFDRRVYFADRPYGIIEAKWTSNRDRFSDGVPDEYMLQGMHYLLVDSDAEKCYLGASCGPNEPEVFTIERDDDLIRTLIDAERAFVQLILDDTPPAADGSAATKDALDRMHPARLEESVPLSPEAVALATEYDLARHRKTQATEDMDLYRNRLIQFLGNRRYGFGDGWDLSYAPPRKPKPKFDEAGFLFEHPEKAGECSDLVLNPEKVREKYPDLYREFLTVVNTDPRFDLRRAKKPE